MNDHHSHVAEERVRLDVDGSDVEIMRGGYPRLAQLVSEVTAESGPNVLKLHAGDAVTGTLWYSLFKGTVDAAAMGYICFDAFALGNHEFDDGDAQLAYFLGNLSATGCGTATLAANVVPGPKSPLGHGFNSFLKPYKVFTVGDDTVGVIDAHAHLLREHTRHAH